MSRVRQAAEPAPAPSRAPTVYTVGHSNLSFEAFLGLLLPFRVDVVIDVRKIPGSRAHPHFGAEALAAGLAEANVRYEHAAALGGRRSGSRDPRTAGWSHPSFRAYAAHALTPEFREALEALIERARREVPALLCAESVWWRCHRRIIADHLLVRGVEVLHVMGPRKAVPASLTPFAVPGPEGLLYPGEPGEP